MNQSEIILYKTEDGAVKIDTIFQNETIWLSQNSMAELFGVNVPAISKHLKNIFEEGELQKEATLSKMETVQNEGGRLLVKLQQNSLNHGVTLKNLTWDLPHGVVPLFVNTMYQLPKIT
jgi:hypothetical protein